MSLIEKIKISFIIILITISVFKVSYSQDFGYPYLINFFDPSKDYLASEIKDFTFLPNGELVAATGTGIVLFDGNNWYKILDGYFLSVAYDTSTHALYIGSNTSFGYIKFNNTYNSFDYIKLSLLVPDKITNVWYIIPSKYGVYFFVGGKFLYFYDNKAIRRVRVPYNFKVMRGFLVNNNLYIIDDGVGIAKIVKDRFVKLTTDYNNIYSHSIRIFLPTAKNHVFLLFTKDGLMYKYNELTEDFIFINDLSKKIPDVEVYNGIYIKDSLIAIATLNKGMLIVNSRGNIIEHISRQNGLTSDKVSRIQLNKSNNIVFLGTGRFMSALLYFYPFRIYNEKNSGFIGDIGDYKIWKNNLFLGTDNGLFVSNKNKRRFELLNAKLLFYRRTMEIMQLPDGREFLLGGSLRYLFLLDKNLKIKILGDYYNLYSLRQSKTDPYKFYALSFDSLFIFRFEPKSLTVRKEKSFNLPTIYSQLEIDKQDNILLLSFNDKVLNYVNIDLKNNSLIVKVIGLNSLVKKIRVVNDSLFLILTNKGLFKYINGQIIPFDITLNEKIYEIEKKSRLLDFYYNKGKLIFLSKRFLYIYDLNNGTWNKYYLLNNFWLSPKNLDVYNELIVFNETYELFFIEIDKLHTFKVHLQEKPIMSLVQIGDYNFYNYFSSDLISHSDSIYTINVEIPYNTPIAFKFNIVNSLVGNKVKYSYFLKGYSKEWSPWQTKDLTFNGLLPGKYTLRVKLLSSFTDKVFNLSINFRIKPPFYLSKLAIGFYILVLVLLVYLIVHLRLRREEMLRAKLEKLVRKRTLELEQKTKILEDNNRMLNLLTEELKANKEELIAQNERLRLTNLELRQLSLVAQYTNNAVLILDDRGRIEWWNKEFANLFKYKFKDKKAIYIPRNIKELRPDIFDRVLNFNPDFKSITYITHEIIPDTGEDIWYQTTITAVKDENEKIFRFVILDIDITESKLAEQEIKLQRDRLKKQTEVLKKVNEELLESRQKLERQHDEMLSSLEYAKRLQKALLPDELFYRLFPESFIFYLPKEIVSGDFYYLDKKGDKVIIALGDATGHGVPGAFMSVLGLTLLKDAIDKNEQDLLPNKILESLRNSVIKALHKNVIFSDIKDGLDIGIAVIDVFDRRMYFSGANISVNIVRDKDVLVEIRADRMAIGIKELAKFPFTLEVMNLENKDRLFLYSDGFIDQFGGDKNKRYKRTRFKNFILSIQNYPMKKQKELFQDELDKWMRDNDQIDDILIIGAEIDFEYLRGIEI